MRRVGGEEGRRRRGREKEERMRRSCEGGEDEIKKKI